MKLHEMEYGWTTPCIITERETYSNHHYTEDGLIGERVTDETATHFIVVEAEIVNDPSTGIGFINVLSTKVVINDIQQD